MGVGYIQLPPGNPGYIVCSASRFFRRLYLQSARKQVLWVTFHEALIKWTKTLTGHRKSLTWRRPVNQCNVCCVDFQSARLQLLTELCNIFFEYSFPPEILPQCFASRRIHFDFILHIPFFGTFRKAWIDAEQWTNQSEYSPQQAGRCTKAYDLLHRGRVLCFLLALREAWKPDNPTTTYDRSSKSTRHICRGRWNEHWALNLMNLSWITI